MICFHHFKHFYNSSILNCVMSDLQDVRCNCDAGEESWRLDEGTLTDRRHLPVTKLNFGHLEEEHQQANFKLGPLYCHGASNPPRVMTSCQATLPSSSDNLTIL